MWRGSWILAVGATVALGTGCLGLGREEAMERIDAAGPITRVDVELDGGDVQIVGGGVVGAEGGVTFRWSDVAPEVVHYVEDGVLQVLGRCDPYAGACLLDVKLTVPADAAVSVVTRSGDVEVRGVNGDVEIATGDGEVVAHTLGGGFFVESDAGGIVADGLSGRYVDARTGDGDVELRLVARPDRLVGRTESGDVLLVVPTGAYRVEADAPRGEVDVGAAIQDDPAADAVIVGETENGDVTIRVKE